MRTETTRIYIMDYVEGVKDVDDYLATQPITEALLVRMFHRVLSAVAYIHANGTVHLDLKPGNILVTPTGKPLISDLGFAKQLTGGDDLTLIGGTEGYLHPDARHYLFQRQEDDITDKNRLRGQAPRKVITKAWDLFGLGKTFLRLLRIVRDRDKNVLSAYTRCYLYLMSCRLLDGHNQGDETAVGLALSTFSEIKYESAETALQDIQKLTGEYDLESFVGGLNPNPLSALQATDEFNVALTPRLKRIIELPIFERLANVTQLGLLTKIYHTASHTRHQHAIGTYGHACKYVTALYNDPLNPLFKQIMQVEDIEAVLLAALLHDIGHFPLAHDIEEADQSLDHEELGQEMLLSERFRIGQTMKEADWNVGIEQVLSVLKADPLSNQGGLRDRILHSIIDGPIDADKIDYLKRDSQVLWLPYEKGLISDAC